MSDPIDIDRVEAVLLVDGWHHVYPRTFDIRPLDFTREEGSMSTEYDAVPGFGFTEEVGAGRFRRFAGPVSSLLGVRYTRAGDEAG